MNALRISRKACAHGLAWLVLLCASALVRAETITYYHTDALGTPVMESDAAGNVTYAREHRPYGEQALGTPKDGPGFTGHVQDADTGLTYMQQRYYDPVAGRFISIDPVATDLATGANFNRYWYANNNPYRFTDPDGRRSKEEHDDKQERSEERQTQERALEQRTKVASNEAIQPVAPEAILLPAVGLVKTLVSAAEILSPSTVNVSASRYPESAAHIKDAQAAGQPRVLTINRPGAIENRRAALEGTTRQSGKDRDEYPPAMFSEGGKGSSIRHISPSDNRGAGACIGAQCRGLPNGARIEIKVGE